MLRYLRRNPYRELEKKLGYSFRKRELLEAALTHRSYRYENAGVADNQRLEFLGDAVLGFLTAAWLYEKHEDKEEGDLTCLRSQITSGKALGQIGAELGLGPFMRLGRGEEASGGRERLSILMDAMEALLGAAFVDGGVRAVQKIFKAVFHTEINSLQADIWAENPKGELQDLCQRRWKSSPHYHVKGKHGPAHEAVFVIEVTLPDGSKAEGQGSSKRESEIAAARSILHRMEEQQIADLNKGSGGAS